MQTTTRDYLFRGELAEIDPEVAELIRHETARQERYLIMIPSESTVPQAVREALSSPFHNIYAEGYPLDETRTMSQSEILDYGARLPEYRRYADQRYYKGTEYADIVEALARRRAAELFATPEYPADKLFVNVQPLSGAPANSAIFSGLINVGDTIMGMDLLQGGHLSHGSPVNRSGKQYNAVSYGVDPVTERLDYDAIMARALEHRPKIIIAGYTSYPFAPDWQKFREIADASGAILMADVSHVSGLIIAGVYPNPVGYADVISFTTHKTLAGPRGAVIITHRADIAKKVDRAVFPGEQGGPHVNAVAALAVALRLAFTDQFKALQRQTVTNAIRLADKLAARGIRIPYGGTNTHLLLIDTKSVVGADGTALSGDQAARVLDLAGIVTNRNTIPGDASAFRASGVRLATPWITQRGFHEAEIDELGDLIADLLFACEPFSYTGKKRPDARTKVDFVTLQRVKSAVRDLAARVGIDTDAGAEDYPHFYYGDQVIDGARTLVIRQVSDKAPIDAVLDAVVTSNVYALDVGQSQPAYILDDNGETLSRVIVERGADGWKLHVENNVSLVASWLRALSDGFVRFDPTDVYAKIPGAFDVQIAGTPDASRFANFNENAALVRKPYFVGINGTNHAGTRGEALPKFTWSEPAANGALKTTPLTELHKAVGAKMAAFAGYEMPLWYSSVSDEHAAVRTDAGVFDVTHMGVFDVRGRAAAAFLDLVTTNEVNALEVGESHYTYFLDTDGIPHDDLMIYRLAADHFLVVVNASNNDKNWAWLNAVKNGDVMIDPKNPDVAFKAGDQVELRDLRAESSGVDRRVDVALQGPRSKAILKSLGGSDADLAALEGLAWAGVTRATFGGFDLIISRTGYTYERIAYELFVHPDQAAALFEALMNAGAAPCGLAARDSLRTEAGLPLYGHELAGDLKLNPADAGFGTYVKLWKPFFIGKAAYIAHEAQRDAEIVRFKLVNRGARPAHPGDPVVDGRGRVVGIVTSCSLDSEGYQTGQAYIKHTHNDIDTQINIFCGSERAKANGVTGLSIGDRVTIPEPAVVLTRFLKKK